MTSYTPLAPVLHPGDLVVLRDGMVLRLERRAQVNWVATDDDGRRYKIRANGLRKAPEGTVFSGPAPRAAANVVLGSVVRFADGVVQRGASSDDLFVVLKVTPDTVNMALLGGDGNRFFRTVLRTEIEEVPVPAGLGR